MGLLNVGMNPFLRRGRATSNGTPEVYARMNIFRFLRLLASPEAATPKPEKEAADDR